MLTRNKRQSLTHIGLLIVLLGMLVLPAIALADNNPPAGYYYTVRQGDTWSIVSQRTGVTVAELKRLNPQTIHPKNWLWIGERLLVPGQPPAVEGYWYQVKPGDTWNTVAKATGVPVRELWRSNPSLLSRQLWLYLGQRVWIPAAPPVAAVKSQATPAAASSAAPAATTASPEAAQPASTAAPSVAPTATAIPSKPGATDGCPASLAGYPDAITAYLNTPGNDFGGLQAWLASCGALAEGDSGVTPVALQSSTSADATVVFMDPAATTPDGKGVLLVYHAGPQGGYTLARKVEGTGTVTLLRAGDFNADGKGDLIWTDTTCGAHTCFSTLFVESWDGTTYRDLLAGEPTMAAADYAFKDVTSEGDGEEILVHGGIIASAGAGPQRAWTETYASSNGAPYTLVNLTYDKSPCLYHVIQDASAALGDWAKDGFKPAIAAYESAISDPALTACWSVAEEVALLKDFARFQLVVSYVADGQSAKAAAVAGQISQPTVKGAADTFLKSYRASGSIIQACRDTTEYAKANPAAWQFLADWGYANPAFTAEDLCPLK